ncbi:MAG TPA: hypothetical protein ENF58_02060 [Candidatus Altiarchaeales archaeon]|nr:MAG: hypothetical protein DRP23_01105 [Thermotogota bacterium]HDI72898.1 hypothetical protein [Candidatus Altiarchaeales archaeon]
MDELDFEILRLLEKEGPKTTQQISQHIRKTKYTTELRLLRLKPKVRELQSKVRGPSIWWLPSLYEYMCKVAKDRLKSMGYQLGNREGLDFYGEAKDKAGGICTDVLDEERIMHEYKKYDELDKFIVLTTKELDLEGIIVWNLMDMPREGVKFIPITEEMNRKLLKNFDGGDFMRFCSEIIRKGLEAKEWI